jgi:membrane-associated phospholipid phosphatase
VNAPLAAAGIAAAIAVAVLAVYIAGHPFIPDDAIVERDVQSVPWGPISVTFPFYSWIGDAKGFVAEVIAFIAILIFNRRAWLIAVGAAASAGWYVLLSHLILRARPTTAQVLRVTEHPGASSFPSGHTIFIVTIVVVLVVCLGYRFLRGWGRVALWVAGALVISGNVIDRMYTGAHWPSDVLAGLLIAAAWLSLWLSWGPVSRRIEPPRRQPSLP